MLRQALATTGAAVVLLGTAALPAVADDGWGTLKCGQNPYPGCELGAGKGGRERGDPSPRQQPERGEPSDRGRGGGAGGAVKYPTKLRCSYQRSTFRPPAGAIKASYLDKGSTGRPPVMQAEFRTVPAVPTAASPRPGEKGSWYEYQCSGNAARDALYRPPVWIPDDEDALAEAAPPPPSPAQLAQQAREQLRLPSPVIRASPAREQLVHLPTWLWLARGSWGSRSAIASVPGVSVTAVARPQKVVWKLGDGSPVTCKGPGTPYGGKSAVSAKRPSPDCGHTYRSSSAGQPGGAYAVSATVHWTVSWSGAGESGTFPGMTTTATAGFLVRESQALNTE